MKRKISYLLLIALFALFVVGCGNNSDNKEDNVTSQTSESTEDSEKEQASEDDVECQHVYSDATCTEPSVCTICGVENSKALGHDFTAATCTEGEVCKKCGVAGKEALGHDVKDADCTKESTCNRCGEKLGGAKGHSFVQATCTKPSTCSVCGATTGSAKGHTYTEATCTKAATCKTCGATNGKAKGHTYTEATCTKAATCKTCGVTNGKAKGHDYAAATCTKASTCKNCGVTNGSAKGHDYTAATCTEAAKCKVCNATNGSAKGHNYSQATCTTPKTCKSCGITEGEALGHNYKEESKTDGNNIGSIITYRCTSCRQTKQDKIEQLSLNAYRSSCVSISGWLSQVGYTINTTGGYGKIQYKYEVFVNESTATPTLTEDFSDNNTFGWTSRYYCNGHVLIVTAKDEAGNKAALKIVVDTEDKITQIEAKDPAISNDKTPPVINSISIDKKKVTIGDEVHITMDIADESKITWCNVVFTMSNGSEGNGNISLKIGEDGLYHGTIKIDNTFVSGKCTLNYIVVEDALSNRLMVSSAYKVYPDIYFEVTGGSNDTTPPVINSVSIDKKKVTIGDEVNLTVAISDESKITTCHVVFKMSNGATGNASCFLTLGDDGLYHGKIQIDNTYVSGKCTLDYIIVRDAISNTTHVSSANEKYPNVYFDVIGGSSDTTPPVINSISIDKKKVSLGDEINLTVAISDESKITTCHVVFKMSNGTTGNASCFLTLGNDGLYHGTIKIDSTFVSGKCILDYILVNDALSNTTHVSSANEKYPDIYFDVVTGN